MSAIGGICCIVILEGEGRGNVDGGRGAIGGICCIVTLEGGRGAIGEICCIVVLAMWGSNKISYASTL